MEWLEDYETLSHEHIKTEEDLREITKGILSALQFLHSQNICHRDIKPDNIMIHRHSRTVKLIDFGISKKTYQRGTRREMLTVIGTPFYLAPEMLLGGGYDERVDLWALGVTLFRTVTGVTPFESEYRSDTVRNIVAGKVSFEDKAWSEYSSLFSDFVDRLLKQVDERISLTEAQQHLWLQSSSQKKIRRSKSEVIVAHEPFHAEMNTHRKNAVSKE